MEDLSFQTRPLVSRLAQTATLGDRLGDPLGADPLSAPSLVDPLAPVQLASDDDDVQRDADGASTAHVHEAAARGTAGPGGALPHLDRIQSSFGHHDVSNVVAHTDGAAAAASRDMGARGFATGDHVAFRGAPDLHTAAHEAAHVIQQGAGVALKKGVGEDGDPYERHADAVADKVEHGESAEDLLDAGPMAAPTVQRDGSDPPPWKKRLMRVLGDQGIAADLLTSVDVAEDLAAVLETFVRVGVIPIFDLDRRLRNALFDALTGWVGTIIGAIAWLDKLLESWLRIPEVLRTTLVYLAGRMLRVIERYVRGLLHDYSNRLRRKLGLDETEEVVNTSAVLGPFEALATLDAAGFYDWYRSNLGKIRKLLQIMPVTTAWKAFGLGISQWVVETGIAIKDYVLSWWRGETQAAAPTVKAPVDETRERQGWGAWAMEKLGVLWGTAAQEVALDVPELSPDAPKPALKKIQLGPMAIVPKKYAIAKTKGKDMGGLEVEAGLEVALLGGSKTVAIDTHAVVDWDGNFRGNVGLATPIELFADANLGLLHLKSVKLVRLDAGSNLLALKLSLDSLEVGSMVKTGAQSLAFSSVDGVQWTADDIDVALPDPLVPLKGNLDVAIGRDGKLRHVVMTKFAATETFTVARAEFSPERGLVVSNARYKLPKGALGDDAWLELVSLALGSDGSIEEALGAFNVSGLQPFGADGGVTIGGTASVGYAKSTGFTFGLDGGHLDVSKDPVYGSAKLGKCSFQQKTNALSGSLERLDLKAGPIAVGLTNGRVVSDGGTKSIAADTAEVVLGNETGKDDLKSLTKGGTLSDDAGSLFGLLGGSKLTAAELVKLTAHNVRYTPGEGLKWDRIDTKVGLPNQAKFSLLNGMITGGYDTVRKTADVGAHFAYPPKGAPLLPTLTAEAHVLPGLAAFVEFGITGGLSGDIAGKLKGKPDSTDLDMQLGAKLQGHLGMRLAAGLTVGTKAVLGLRGYLEGSAGVTASGESTLMGSVKKQPDGRYDMQPGPENKLLDFKLHGDVTAKVDVVADVVALMVLSHQLFRHNLKTWKLGEFDVEGYLYKDGGSIKHKLVKPDKAKVGKDDKTLGGALRAPLAIDKEALQPIPVKDAVAMIVKSGRKVEDHRLMNRLITDVIDADSVPESEKQTLIDDIKGASKLGSGSRKHTDASGTEATVTNDALANQYEKDARAYRTERTLLPGFVSSIMTRRQWETYSTTKGFIGDTDRKSIVGVDEAIEAYHGVVVPQTGGVGSTKSALNERMRSLGALEEACTTYVAKSSKSRVEMVQTLLFSIDRERQSLTVHLERLRETALSAKFSKQAASQ